MRLFFALACVVAPVAVHATEAAAGGAGRVLASGALGELLEDGDFATKELDLSYEKGRILVTFGVPFRSGEDGMMDLAIKDRALVAAKTAYDVGEAFAAVRGEDADGGDGDAASSELDLPHESSLRIYRFGHPREAVRRLGAVLASDAVAKKIAACTPRKPQACFVPPTQLAGARPRPAPRRRPPQPRGLPVDPAPARRRARRIP